jgi:NYN domain/OST-HTH/LOTUS domain
MKNSKIAIFIDVENLTQWVKEDGPEKLLSELSSTGQIIVRRAYGNWTNQNLFNFQGNLNRSGFELIHNYHPISGKNSSDIQLTIDVMEYALRLNDVEWFVLATGDSDFSPLFRRLREIGKEVIGVGPRSALSESVKTSCSRYIYTDITQETIKLVIDDAIDLVEKALKNFDEPAPFSLLKNAMINIDSAFDEKALGFKSFSEFLKSIDSVELVRSDDTKTWLAAPKLSKRDNAEPLRMKKDEEQITALVETYQKLLKEKSWPSIPKDYLSKVYNVLITLPPLPKNELTEAVIGKLEDNKITSTDIKKAISIFLKSKLIFLNTNVEESPDKNCWQLGKNENYIRDINVALIARLISGCIENDIELDANVVVKCLYETYKKDKLQQLINQGNALYKEIKQQYGQKQGILRIKQ